MSCGSVTVVDRNLNHKTKQKQGLKQCECMSSTPHARMESKERHELEYLPKGKKKPHKRLAESRRVNVQVEC